MAKRVLIVDHECLCDRLKVGLDEHGFAMSCCRSATEASAALASDELDAVVIDLAMPGVNGTELCERWVSNRPDVPVIAISSLGTLEMALAAIRAGASDFLAKPFEFEAFLVALERAVRHHALRVEVTRLRRAIAEPLEFEEIVGASATMKKVFDLLERVADSEATVLVTGETGTGKELVARALHGRSRRQGRPFVALNCAAMPEPLLESELFGHAKGAFTDAVAERNGLLFRANTGTLLLDEVGEMLPGMQVKLLRALQERTVRPLGGDEEVPFDVRIIAATSRDLETAVAEGLFREDLFYRLNVIHIDLPPLRARSGDVLLLAQHFLEHYAARANKDVVGLSSGIAEKLLAYPWPGNVRELQNCIERAVALTAFDRLTIEDLPERVGAYTRSHVLVASDDPSELVPMDEVERRYVLRVLEAVGENKTLAAQILGFDRKTLYRKLERYHTDSGRWSVSKFKPERESPSRSAPRSGTRRSGSKSARNGRGSDSTPT